MAPSRRTASITERALPKAQSRAWRNWFWIRFPVITVRDPPRWSGITNSPEEGMTPASAEVLARLFEPHVELLQGCVEGEDHERQVGVGHAHEDRLRGEDQVNGAVRYAEELQGLVGNAVAAEDHDPGVGADEQARPERDHDE